MLILINISANKIREFTIPQPFVLQRSVEVSPSALSLGAPTFSMPMNKDY